MRPPLRLLNSNPAPVPHIATLEELANDVMAALDEREISLALLALGIVMVRISRAAFGDDAIADAFVAIAINYGEQYDTAENERAAGR